MSPLLISAVRFAVGLLVLIPLAGLASHDAGALQPYDCRRELAENTRSAKLTDRYIKGIVSVGLNEGVTAPQARDRLRELDANFFVPSPWREHVVVCVPHGEEEAWAERLEDEALVEWAHREGIRPLEAQGD